MIDVIIKLKQPAPADVLALLAQEALDTFGEGGNPEASQIEGYIGFTNTPVYGEYCRFTATEAYGMAIEYIESQGGSQYCELVRVEWPQEEPYPPITYLVDTYDEEGNVIGQREQEIGVIR